MTASPRSIIQHAAPILLTLAAALTLLVTPDSVAAQGGSIAGTIRAVGTTSPLSTVLVEVQRADGTALASTLSGPTGAFRIDDIPAGSYQVLFRIPGWEEHQEPVIVTAGDTEALFVELQERVFNLNPITVTASKQEEKVLEAPADVEVIPTLELQELPAVTVADHLKKLAAVDIIKTGLQQNYVVVRGFNNIFSGATLTLTDNRIARVPSLRANVTHLTPTTNADLERVEVVLGPGSALYGPNAANGVIHSITKSPIDYPGGWLSVAGGLRNQGQVPGTTGGSSEFTGHVEGRYALAPSSNFGIKASGQYFSGEDYFFDDPEEAAARGRAVQCQQANYAPSNPACASFGNGLDLSDPADVVTLRSSVDNVAAGRDNLLKRWSADIRADWRPSEDLSLIFSGGHTRAINSVDLTGIGGAQAVNWGYTYLQGRAIWKSAFAQVFWNKSNNDESFLFRSGRPLRDRSSLLVAQLQNVSRLNERNSLTYGLDLLRTVPRTDGTINGLNEDDDDITEVGGYVQYELNLDRWDFVAAARLDDHSRLEDPVFSPRAAIVWRPNQENTLRATYNRAFSTPTTLNLFLDISAGTIASGTFPLYDVRALGSTGNGLQFRRTDGAPDSKSPFNAAGPQAFLATTTGNLWQLALRAIGLSNPALAEQLAQLPPPTSEQVRVEARTLNPTAPEGTPPFFSTPGICSPGAGGQPVCDLTRVPDLPLLRPTITNTFEVGYKGLLGESLLLSANAYYSRIVDFTSALQVSTPHAFLNASDIEAYLQGYGFPAEQARAVALAIGGDLNDPDEAGIPLSVMTYDRSTGGLPVAALTYQNLGDVDLFGWDLAATYVLGGHWELGATVAWVSDDTFDTGTELVPLNAPTFKGSLGLRYRNEESGWNAGGLLRGQNGFPANSGVYVGDVKGFGTLDLNVGYRFPTARPVTVQLDVQNVLTFSDICPFSAPGESPSCGLFEKMYQSFVGSPYIGRYGTLRLIWEF